MARLPLAVSAARPIVFSYLASSGALITAAAAQLTTFAILARALGPRQFGLYIQFAAGAAVAVQLCGLGASDSMIRRVSRERDAYRDLLGHNLIVVMASGLLLVAVGTPLTHWRFSFDPRASVDIAAAFLLLISNVVLLRLVLLVETIFLSLGRAADANRAVIGFAVARTVIAAIACDVLSTTTVAQWAAMQFCGFCLYAVFCCWWLRRLGGPRWRLLSEEIRPGLLFASQFVARAVRQNIDLLALGAILSPATIGSYGIARRISDASFLSIDAMNRLLYPRLARVAHCEPTALTVEVRRAVIVAVLLGSATAIALFFAAPLLPYLTGRAYADAADFLRILSGLIVFMAVWSIAMDVLGASDHHGARAAIMNGTNIVGILLVFVASSMAALPGAFLAFYSVEAITVLIGWSMVFVSTRRSAPATSL